MNGRTVGRRLVGIAAGLVALAFVVLFSVLIYDHIVETRRDARISGAVMWAVWIPVIVAIVVFQLKGRAGVWHTLGVFLLVTYAFWIASAAFFPMPIERGHGLLWSHSVTVVPFRGLVHSFAHMSQGQIIRQHGGNFLLLVPFTLIGPALSPRLRAWRWALAIGVGASAGIELLQLGFSALRGGFYRSVDINDVILNTAGALLGYAVFLGVRKAARLLRSRVAALD
jgi:glycopeptide antibiotics resistance protein